MKPYSDYHQIIRDINKKIVPLQEEIDRLCSKKEYELLFLEESMTEIKNTIEINYPLLFPYLSQRLSDFLELWDCDFFKKAKKETWTLKDYLFHVLFLSDWGRLSIPFPKTKDKGVKKELKKFFVDLGYKVSYSNVKDFGLTLWTHRFYYGDKNQNYFVFILQ